MVCFVSHHILYVENLCFGWFHAISLPHLTHCENQYRVHLMHEFMPPKPFLIFRTEHAQSTILGIKLMFWVVPSHFVAALDTLQKPYRGAFNARVYASRTVSWFFAANMPSQLL